MDALYQRFKELAPHTFERLTLDLLKEWDEKVGLQRDALSSQ